MLELTSHNMLKSGPCLGYKTSTCSHGCHISLCSLWKRE